MICCATLGASAAQGATPGALDPTFGRGGKVTVLQYEFVSSPGVATNANVKLQPDGRIVVAGPIFETFGVVRFLSSGQLDSSFGAGGVAQDAIGQDSSAPQDLAIQPDGKIVVVGSAESSDAEQNFVALARFNVDGSLDATFGTGGTVLTPARQFSVDSANVVLLQPDGKIVIGGTSAEETQHPPPPVAIVQRYNVDGSLDASFASGGELVLQPGNITALALQTDGKILLNIKGLTAPVLLERLLPNGTIDSSQVAGTIATTAHTCLSTFQPDGRFVLASTVQDGQNGDTDLQAMRFTSDGAVDPSFASPVIDFGGSRGALSTANAIALQVDGKVLVGGDAAVASGDFGLERLNTDGNPDLSFGKAGGLVTAFNSKFFGVVLTSLALQPDGKILAVGVATDGTLALARYLP